MISGLLKIQSHSGGAAGRVLRASLLFVCIAVIVYGFAGDGASWAWQREGFTWTTSYTLISSHFAHFTLEHLAWDSFALVVVGTLAAKAGMRRWWLTVLGSTLLIPLAVYAMLPAITSYRGLSGIGSALFALAAVTLLRSQIQQGERRNAWLIVLCMAAFAGKIAWEATAHTAVFATNLGAGNVPVALAHVVGGICGAAVACIRFPALTANMRSKQSSAASL